MRSIRRLLPDSKAQRSGGLKALHRMLEVRGGLSEEAARRLARIGVLFGEGKLETDHDRHIECPGT